jgi:hypothetical protein
VIKESLLENEEDAVSLPDEKNESNLIPDNPELCGWRLLREVKEVRMRQFYQ